MADQWQMESSRILEYEKDRDRLAMAIDQHLAYARERKMNRALQWFRNAAFLAGQHLDVFRYRNGQFTQDAVIIPPRFQDVMSPQMVDNHIIRIVQANIAELTGMNPYPAIEPASLSPDDQDLATIGQLALQVLWEDPLRVPEKLRLMLGYLCICGTAGVETYFGQLDSVEERMKIGKVKIPDIVSGGEIDDWGETGETEWVQREGIRLRVWSGFHIDVNPDATSDPDSLMWVCRTTFEDVQLMKRMFDQKGPGYHPEALAKVGPQECTDDPLWHWEQTKDLVDSPSTELPVTLERGARRTLANCCRVRMIDCRPNTDHPMGRTIVQIAGQVVYDGPSRSWSEEYPEDWTPMEISRWWTLPGRFEGIPLISKLVPLQKRINALHALIRLSRQHMGIGAWLLPKACSVPEGFIGPMPGQNIPYRFGPRGEKPERVEFQPLTEDIWRELDMCVASMERLGGIASAQLGANVSASALRSGTMLDFGQRQALQSKSALMLDFEGFVGRLAGRILKQVSLHLKDNPELLRRVSVAARDLGDLAMERYTSLDLRDNVRVRIDIRSQMLQTPEARKEAAATFLQFTGQKGLSPSQLARVASIMGLSELEGEVSAQYKRARRMVERVLQGDVASAVVLEGVDDPGLFAEVVRDGMLSERATAAPLEVKQALSALMDAYSEQMARRASMQASVIAQAQNSAPVASPGAPGQTGA